MTVAAAAAGGSDWVTVAVTVAGAAPVLSGKKHGYFSVRHAHGRAMCAHDAAARQASCADLERQRCSTTIPDCMLALRFNGLLCHCIEAQHYQRQPPVIAHWHDSRSLRAETLPRCCRCCPA
jgi:hypothetical protein